MTHRRLKVLVTAMTVICAVIQTGAAAQTPEIATAVAFTEGPAADRDGKVRTEIAGLPR